MNTYDVRNQIKIENKKRLFGNVIFMMVIFVILIFVIGVGNLTRPFHIIKPETDEELLNAYEDKISYIILESVEAEFTGYSKIGNSGEVIYNCYAISFDKLKYFVFVPSDRSGASPANPDKTLKDYSFVAKLQKDEELFELVSGDYETGPEEFEENYGVSSIILNEAKSDRNDLLALWVLFVIVIVMCIGYVIAEIKNLNDITKSKSVMRLLKYGKIETVLNEINKEMRDKRIFDSNHISITQNWFMSFCEGSIIIIKICDIRRIEEESSVKKAYGLVPIGTVLAIRLEVGDNEIYHVQVETLLDTEEIIEAVLR